MDGYGRECTVCLWASAPVLRLELAVAAQTFPPIRQGRSPREPGEKFASLDWIWDEDVGVGVQHVCGANARQCEQLVLGDNAGQFQPQVPGCWQREASAAPPFRDASHAGRWSAVSGLCVLTTEAVAGQPSIRGRTLLAQAWDDGAAEANHRMRSWVR